MTKWYVTVNENSDHADDPDVRVWTVSRDPDDTGWETDGGFPGYGLTKHDAEELANAANRVKMTEWQPIETAPKDGTCFIGYFYHAEQGSFYQMIGWDAYAKEFGRDPSWLNSCNEPWDGFTHWTPLPDPPKQEAK